MDRTHESPRTPAESAPQRMQPLARLPVFFALAGKRVFIAGGNAAAAWKVELLAAAGAHVDVYAVDPSDEVLEAAATPPAGTVAVHRLPWFADLEAWAVRHTLGCLLARVAGRSPLEYLTDVQRERQLRAVLALMADPPENIVKLGGRFITFWEKRR